MEQLTTVDRTMFVDASPGTIWKALTEPQLTKLYRGNRLVFSQWKRGTPIRWVELVDGHQVLREKGTIMACQPGRRLRYTSLNVESDLADDRANETTVDILLEPDRDDRTKVTLWQGDFAGLPDAARRAREAGRDWVEALVGLKRVAEEQQRALAA